jgi:hypothetical protein
MVDCPGCGHFGLDGQAEAQLSAKLAIRALVSHRIRLSNERKEEIDVTAPMLRVIVESYQLPSISKQKDSFMRWFGGELLRIGQPHSPFVVREPRRISALIGAAPPIAKGGLMYVMKALFVEGYISPLPNLYADNIQMTPKGWERCEILTTPKPSAVPYSPRELPMAIDFLNSIWGKRNGEPLLEIRSAEITVSLGLPSANFEEFKSRIGDLAELLRWIDVEDAQLPGGAEINRSEKLNRLQACLQASTVDSDRDDVGVAVGALKDIVTVRNRLTHKGSPELIGALARLGIDFPIEDYASAWDGIRAKAAEALNLIRKVVQATD